MSRLLAVAIAFILLAGPAAHAAIKRAENVLPPGQSGFVAPSGLLDGSGSMHAYDQVPLFTSFRWKPMTFDRPAAATEEPKPGVTIGRDEYGIPIIKASTAEDAWFGAGYAVAEDRLFQIELFQRATTGRLAEILGRDYLDDDLIARRDYYTDGELARMLAAAPPNLQARAKAYRDGVNAYIARVRSDPGRLPGEFLAAGLPPSELSATEQAAIGVFLARTVPSGDGNELTNLRLLRAAGTKALKRLIPIRQKRETYTVPPTEATFPNQPGRTARQERDALRRSVAASAAWELPSEQATARARAHVSPGLPGQLGGSYMFAAARKGDGGVLFNGPQLGFSTPELFVELELHYPGADLRGVTAAGVPLIGIGTNGKVAWGFTSGLSDEDDLYAEKLTGEESYEFRGEQRKMDCRTERFAYAARLIAVVGGKPPENGATTERICRTVHGPVQLRAGKTAYARRYAIWGRELETLEGIALLNDAGTVHDVDQAMQRVTWNENVIAIDSAGGLGYWHPGLHQLRPRRWDERLPYPGTGEAEWRGLRDRRDTPHVLNPKQGWLANWNNLPAKGWTTGDAESSERLAGAFHRAAFLQRLVRPWAADPTIEGAQDIVRATGTTAQQRPLATARLRKAAQGATGNAAAVLGALRAWQGSYAQTDAAGTVDPGVAIWEELKDQLETRALQAIGADNKAGRAAAGGTGSSHAFDISNGEAYALRTATGADIRAAAGATFDALAKRFATQDVARWREPRREYEWQVQGAQSPPPIPFFDRGTYEQFIELAP